MKKLIGKVLKMVLSALVTPKMIIWALEFATKQTKNKIDDNIVGIVKAGYNSDIEGIQEATQKLLEALVKKD